ncbi:MAG: hypothetical protein QM610_09710 [Chitinophagaceae bacterium]
MKYLQYKTEQQPLSTEDLAELRTAKKKVNKYLWMYLLLEAFSVFIFLLFLSLQVIYKMFSWPSTIILLLIVPIVLNIHPLTLLYLRSSRLLKKDLNANQKTVVQGELRFIVPEARDMVYSVNWHNYPVRIWPTMIGWKVDRIQYLNDKNIVLHHLPNSRLLLQVQYLEIPENTSKTEPLTQEQLKIFADAKMKMTSMQSVSGIVTECLELSFSVGSPTLLPAKIARVIQAINNRKMRYIRLGNSLYALNSDKQFSVGEQAEIKLFQ